MSPPRTRQVDRALIRPQEFVEKAVGADNGGGGDVACQRAVTPTPAGFALVTALGWAVSAWVLAGGGRPPVIIPAGWNNLAEVDAPCVGRTSMTRILHRVGWIGLTLVGALMLFAVASDLAADHRSGLPTDDVGLTARPTVSV